jgi:hypothetical protein
MFQHSFPYWPLSPIEFKNRRILVQHFVSVKQADTNYEPGFNFPDEPTKNPPIGLTFMSCYEIRKSLFALLHAVEN